MADYYVCLTNGCSRNRPKYFVYEVTVRLRGDDRCLECGMRMTRRNRAIKGRNTKPGIRVRAISTSPRTTIKANRKRDRGKTLYKR